MVKKFIGLLIFMCSAVMLAVAPSYDALNSYQFNRKNVMQNNGKKIQTPWFEWWYYKVVLPEKNKSFFFVYGVVNPWDTTESNSATRSYITMGSFSDNEIVEKKFPLSDFSASYTSTDVRVGEGNRATDLFFKGELETELGSRGGWDVSIKKIWGF